MFRWHSWIYGPIVTMASQAAIGLVIVLATAVIAPTSTGQVAQVRKQSAPAKQDAMLGKQPLAESPRTAQDPTPRDAVPTLENAPPFPGPQVVPDSPKAPQDAKPFRAFGENVLQSEPDGPKAAQDAKPGDAATNRNNTTQRPGLPAITEVPQAPPDPQPGDVVVALASTTLRLGPQVLAEVPQGARLRFRETNGDWANVAMIADGRVQEGWVEKRLLKVDVLPANGGQAPGRAPFGDANSFGRGTAVSAIGWKNEASRDVSQQASAQDANITGARQIQLGGVSRLISPQTGNRFRATSYHT